MIEGTLELSCILYMYITVVTNSGENLKNRVDQEDRAVHVDALLPCRGKKRIINTNLPRLSLGGV